MAEKKQFQIRLYPDTIEAIKQAANEHRVSMTRVIEEAVLAYLHDLSEERRLMAIEEQLKSLSDKIMVHDGLLDKLLRTKVVTVKGDEMMGKHFYTVIFQDRQYKMWADSYASAYKKVMELDPEMRAVCSVPGVGHHVDVLFTDTETGTEFE